MATFRSGLSNVGIIVAVVIVIAAIGIVTAGAGYLVYQNLSSGGSTSSTASTEPLVSSSSGGSMVGTDLIQSLQQLQAVTLSPAIFSNPSFLSLTDFGVAHITGGGLVNNLARVIPRGVTAKLDRRTWQPLPVFGFVAGHGRVDRSRNM